MKLLTILTTFFLFSAAFADTTVKMYFKNEDIEKIIEMYSKASGQKFVVDPGVRGRVSIFNQEPVTLEEAFNQLSSALAINGFGISKQGDTMVVKSARNIQRDLVEVNSELPALKPERMATWVYKPQFIPAGRINRELRILPSRDGEMNIVEPSNQIVISDWTSNLHRVAEILKQIDKPVDAQTTKLINEFKSEQRESLQRPGKKSAEGPDSPASAKPKK